MYLPPTKNVMKRLILQDMSGLITTERLVNTYGCCSSWAAVVLREMKNEGSVYEVRNPRRSRGNVHSLYRKAIR